MSRTGNPAKAAAQATAKTIAKQVRQGIEAGKGGAIIPVTPETKVHILTHNPDEAEFMAGLIAQGINFHDNEEFGSVLWGMEISMQLYGLDPVRNKEITKVLRRMLKYHERMPTSNKRDCPPDCGGCNE